MQDQAKAHKSTGFASLHGGLLARKGQAQPAIADLDLQRRARRGDRDGEENSSLLPRKGVPVEPATRPRVTLRMTSRQQRLLRLVAAATDRSQQDILSAALDQHLTRIIGEELGQCRCLRRLVLNAEARGVEKAAPDDAA